MRALGGCLTVVLLVVALVPDEAAPQSRRRECRQSCGAAIDACVSQGGKRRRCKKQTLRRCRKQGVVSVCTVTTTTTAADLTTTTGTGASTTTNPGGSTTTVSTPGSTTTTAPTDVHGCAFADATDLSAELTPTVTFGPVFAYDPNCARIQAGQSITFNGDLSFHPLVGGQIVGGSEVPDPSSPIGSTSSGTSKTVAFPAAGTYPYYCDSHGYLGMTGAVYVTP